ncbi:hypothetical protein EAG_07254 [Camponotus floridanus]|uniref:Uncharacterized protein n=1 Tax=Camponotus floridanus TaxID=104421 RepID=E2AMP7_CAMFO|nr:hypothetical protein EAG_07254 [Camponotus floridanus]
MSSFCENVPSLHFYEGNSENCQSLIAANAEEVERACGRNAGAREVEKAQYGHGSNSDRTARDNWIFVDLVSPPRTARFILHRFGFHLFNTISVHQEAHYWTVYSVYTIRFGSKPSQYPLLRQHVGDICNSCSDIIETNVEGSLSKNIFVRNLDVLVYPAPNSAPRPPYDESVKRVVNNGTAFLLCRHDVSCKRNRLRCGYYEIRNGEEMEIIPDICGLLESIIIRNGSCWALCALESPCFVRKETHPDDIKARNTLFTYPLPSNLDQESFSRSVEEPSHFRPLDPFALRPNDM